MALVFMDGFDHYAVEDLGKKWSVVVEDGLINPVTAEIAAGRVFGSSLKLTSSPLTPCAVPRLTYLYPSAVTAGVVGFALKYGIAFPSTTTPYRKGVLSLGSGAAAHVVLRIGSDGTFTVLRQNTVNAWVTLGGPYPSGLVLGNWAYVEVKYVISDTVGEVHVRVNGSVICDLTEVDTRGVPTAATVSSVNMLGMFNTGAYFGQQLEQSCEVWLDDVYILDNAAGLNDFLGDVAVQVRYPTGAGATTQLTPSAGANYQCVDEAVANKETDYVSSNAVNTLDTYEFEDVVAGTEIKGVQVNIMAKKSDTGTAAVADVVRSDGSDRANATPQGMSTGWVNHRFVHETDPSTGVAWTDSGFNGAEFGIKKTA